VTPDLQKRAAPWLHVAALAAIWAALIAAPFWMPLFGGYTALGSRVLVLGLAAMSLNFLLGFTGVLSFGHAATSTAPDHPPAGSAGRLINIRTGPGCGMDEVGACLMWPTMTCSILPKSAWRYFLTSCRWSQLKLKL
jgi:hypothetical protein